MPPVETQSLNQWAVLWEAGPYDAYGKYKVQPAIEVRCRWETKRDMGEGAQDTVASITDTVFVDRFIKLGSILWKGKLVDLPITPTNLKEVSEYKEVPDLKGRRFQRTLTVVRYNEQLPTVVA